MPDEVIRLIFSEVFVISAIVITFCKLNLKRIDKHNKWKDLNLKFSECRESKLAAPVIIVGS